MTTHGVEAQCTVDVIDRDSRVSVEVVHIPSGIEVAIIGNGAVRGQLQARALQRVEYHLKCRALKNHAPDASATL